MGSAGRAIPIFLLSLAVFWSLGVRWAGAEVSFYSESLSKDTRAKKTIRSNPVGMSGSPRTASAVQEPDALSKLMNWIKHFWETSTKKEDAIGRFVETYQKQEKETYRVIQKGLESSSEGIHGRSLSNTGS